MFTHVCQYLCLYIDGKSDDVYGKVPGKEADLERRSGVKEITPADLISDSGTETTGTCFLLCQDIELTPTFHRISG